MRETTVSGATDIRIMVASRDAIYTRYLTERLSGAGMRPVALSPTDPGALAGLDPAEIDVAIVETHGLDERDWALVELVRERAPLVEVIAISDGPLVDRAVQALRLGVFSILPYPVSDVQLVNEITRACARKRHGEQRLRATQGRVV